MALSDFQDDYTTRQAGLQAWLNGAGNATPDVSAYPGQAAPLTPAQSALQQYAAAKSAGFDTSDINPGATQSTDLSGIEPNQKAAALAQEAFSPGTQNAIPSPAPPSVPFRNTTAGAVLAGMMPHTFGAAFNQQNNAAAADAIQNIPSDNDPTIAMLQNQAKNDPSNGRAVASALAAYMSANQSPIEKTHAKTAALQEAGEEFKINQLHAGMAAAAADAPGGSGQPAPMAMPQANGSLRGQPMPSSSAIAGAMNSMPNNASLPVGGSAANPPPLPMAAPVQPMTPQQQHIELLRQQAAQGLIPYADYLAAKDPTNPANIPTHKMEGDVLMSAQPGEEPKPYAVPPMSNSTFKVGDGGVILPSKTFGFTTQPHTTATLKIAQDQDKSMQAGDQSNNNVIKDMQRQLDILQDNLPHVHTGVGFGPMNQFTAGVNGMMPIKTAGMQEQEDSYSKAEMAGKTLALDAQGLNKTAGSGGGRAGKLALSVTLDSKPGMDKSRAANISQINDIRSNLADLETSRDLYQKYRELSPYGVTDDQTRQLDDALKAIYPTSTKDGSGNVIFNQHNADVIRSIIPHAIANPTPYLKQASMMNQTSAPSYDPNKAAATAAPSPKVMNFDAQGNLIK